MPGSGVSRIGLRVGQLGRRWRQPGGHILGLADDVSEIVPGSVARQRGRVARLLDGGRGFTVGRQVVVEAVEVLRPGAIDVEPPVADEVLLKMVKIKLERFMII